ncbi:MAG: hypothetical protein KGI57_12465 [Hyphomicrobiales bacterium]|nr:hypothetical protein [Hyphomicrobiales bacterium]MDE2018503.1 hypothetical protein [Hyphomicrobiales bacterium]
MVSGAIRGGEVGAYSRRAGSRVGAVAFDPKAGAFRGEFVGLAGGADFRSDGVAGLRDEGSRSLALYLDLCRE